MRADEIMISNFPLVPETASLQQAARLMAERHSSVVAVQHDEGLVGILTHRDLAIGGCGGGCDPCSTTVASIMATPMVVLPVDADLRAVLDRMTEQGVEALFVGAAPERPLGLLTREHVLAALARPDDRPRGPVPEHVKRVRGDAT